MELTEALKGSQAESFVKMVKLELDDIGKKFFSIGFRLNEASSFEYYKELGYEDIFELAETEFSFKRSSTYQLISVFRKFAVWDGCYRKEIKEEFKNYSYSQLVELSKLPYIPCPLSKYIPHTSSVREVSAYVKYYKTTSSFHLTLPEWKEKLYLPFLNNKNSKQLSLDTLSSSVQTSGQVEDVPDKQVEEYSKQTITDKDISDCLKNIDKLIKPDRKVRLERLMSKRTVFKQSVSTALIRQYSSYNVEITMGGRKQNLSVFLGCLAGGVFDIIEDLIKDKK